MFVTQPRRPMAFSRGLVVAAVAGWFALAGGNLDVAWAEEPVKAEPPASTVGPVVPPRPGVAPFTVGEEARYELRYGPLKAGTMTLGVAAVEELPKPLVEASASTPPATAFWRLVGRAESSAFVEVFYRVDDAIEGWVERETFRPRTLEIRVDETGERGTRHVVYDHDAGVARYERQRIYHRKRGPSMLTRDDPLDPHAFDAFSLFFYLRTLDLAPGDRVDLPVHENGKNRQVRIDVGPSEKVSTPLGKRQALPLTIRWTLEGKLASRRAYRLWLSDDELRLPIRFAAELGFGSLRGVLSAYQPGEEAPVAPEDATNP